jgi:deoxynucleoside kinase
MEIRGNLSSQPFTVNVEGNIGSGKSTFLDYFKNLDDFLVLEEPVDKWKNLHGHNLLDLKFNNPSLFQFPFQSYATLTRLRQHVQASDKAVKIMERSLLTARHCFVENLHDSGALHDGMYEVLNQYYAFINESHPIRCDLIVYLRTSPEVAMSRVQCRARKEEVPLSDEYLVQLHNRHEALLYDVNKVQIPVITIDASKSIEEMAQEYQRVLELINVRLLESFQIGYKPPVLTF